MKRCREPDGAQLIQLKEALLQLEAPAAVLPLRTDLRAQSRGPRARRVEEAANSEALTHRHVSARKPPPSPKNEPVDVAISGDARRDQKEGRTAGWADGREGRDALESEQACFPGQAFT